MSASSRLEVHADRLPRHHTTIAMDGGGIGFPAVADLTVNSVRPATEVRSHRPDQVGSRR